MTSQTDRQRLTGHQMGPVQRILLAGAAISLTLTGTATVAHDAVAEGSECKDVYVVAVPGTNQGAPHSNGRTDAVAAFGEEVATVVKTLTEGLSDKSLKIGGVNYPALGVDGLQPATAKLAYDISTYKASKDKGYSHAYSTVQRWGSNCSQTQFVLAGFSQGAHIAGDLAQSILHGHGPVDRERLAAAVLIGDPAYNSTSPNANEFRYDGPKTEGDDRDQRTLVTDPDHWKIRGSLGERAAFDAKDPVISVCVYGDPICDATSVGWNGYNAGTASEKAWMHGLYTHVKYTGSQDLATWAGREAASKVSD